MHLSIDSRPAVAQGMHRVLPQANALNAGPDLYVSFALKLQEANVIGDDLMPALGQSGNQSRLPDAGRTDKRDATACEVNGRRVKRGNSSLMAQHSERGTQQVGTNFASVRGGRRVHQDFFAGPHKKAANSGKVEEYLSSVVSPDVLPIAVRRRSLGSDRGPSDCDVIVRRSVVGARVKSNKRKIRNDPQASETVECHSLS